MWSVNMICDLGEIKGVAAVAAGWALFSNHFVKLQDGLDSAISIRRTVKDANNILRNALSLFQGIPSAGLSVLFTLSCPTRRFFNDDDPNLI